MPSSALLHQVDAAARRVHLLAPQHVGGAGGQAEAAVHAVVDQLGIDAVDRAGPANSRSVAPAVSASDPSHEPPGRHDRRPGSNRSFTRRMRPSAPTVPHRSSRGDLLAARSARPPAARVPRRRRARPRRSARPAGRDRRAAPRAAPRTRPSRTPDVAVAAPLTVGHRGDRSRPGGTRTSTRNSSPGGRPHHGGGRRTPPRPRRAPEQLAYGRRPGLGAAPSTSTEHGQRPVTSGQSISIADGSALAAPSAPEVAGALTAAAVRAARGRSGRSRSPSGGRRQRVQAERRLGDHAERAVRAGEQLAEVVARRRS